VYKDEATEGIEFFKLLYADDNFCKEPISSILMFLHILSEHGNLKKILLILPKYEHQIKIKNARHAPTFKRL